MAKQMVPLNKAKKPQSDPMGNMIEDFITDFWLPYRLPEMDVFKLDVKEDENGYTVEAEVPGAQRKDIALNLDNGRLTIAVQEKETDKPKKEKVIHRERRYTYMERSVYLADATNVGAEAKLENGELIVTVPKDVASATTKAIEIK